MPTTACEEKVRLLIDYRRLTLTYSEAIGDMAVKNLSYSEYRHFRYIAEKARHSSTDARDRLRFVRLNLRVAPLQLIHQFKFWQIHQLDIEQ
jgi:hypothetical protein